MHILFMMSVTTVFTLVLALSNAHAQMFIYPLNGQTSDQQELDEFTCHKWAKQQTGFDPNQQTAATSAPKQKRGGMLGGAMGGAALGAIGGAIAGNAGKGAAIGAAVGGGAGAIGQRRSNSSAQEQQEQASSQQQQTNQTFNRAYSVCLEGKGYKVG